MRLFILRVPMPASPLNRWVGFSKLHNLLGLSVSVGDRLDNNAPISI